MLLNTTANLTYLHRGAQLWLSFLGSISISTLCSAMVHHLPTLFSGTHEDLTCCLLMDQKAHARYLVTCQEIQPPRPPPLPDMQPIHRILVLALLCGLERHPPLPLIVPRPLVHKGLSVLPLGLVCSPDSDRSLRLSPASHGK